MHEIQTPETTKPLTSLETRGFVYIEFGGEGEIRNYPRATFGACPPGLQGLQPCGAHRICPSAVPEVKRTRLQNTAATGVFSVLC